VGRLPAAVENALDTEKASRGGVARIRHGDGIRRRVGDS
jgi:hypothetical protein